MASMVTSLSRAQAIAERFEIPPRASVAPFDRRGNINHDAFLVTAPGFRAIVQRINTEVFAFPDRVIGNMRRSVAAQRESGAPESWRVPALVPAREGGYAVEDEGTWRMMEFIEGTVSFRSLAEVPEGYAGHVARGAGIGLARYLDATAALDPREIRPSLPGYRDAALYLAQWDAALAGEAEGFLPGDPELLASSGAHFAPRLPRGEWLLRRDGLAPEIALVARHRGLLTLVSEEVASGALPTRAVHGDPKLENFLFDAATLDVVSLVDLDTIMAHSPLVDYGDLVRSLVNASGEASRDLDAVVVDEGVYAALAEGFLESYSGATARERELMPLAVRAITPRARHPPFLADHLRGDTYFTLARGDAPDLNLVRGRCCLRLFERLLAREDAMTLV